MNYFLMALLKYAYEVKSIILKAQKGHRFYGAPRVPFIY